MLSWARSTSANFDFGQQLINLIIELKRILSIIIFIIKIVIIITVIIIITIITEIIIVIIFVGGPKGGAPKGGGAQNFALFFSLSCQNCNSFFFLSGFFSWNFGGVLKRRDPQMCTFGVLGLSGSRPSKHHQNSTRRPPREGRNKKIVVGEGKKEKRNFGRSGDGGPGGGRSRGQGGPGENKKKGKKKDKKNKEERKRKNK